MTVKSIHADVETRSPVDLPTCGAFVYFEHPDTTVLMMAYRLDDGPLKIWTYDRPCPADLADAITDGAKIYAWNAQFEYLAFNLLADRNGWPRPRDDVFVDTAAAASAMSLPRALGNAAAALALDVQKDKDGYRLIKKFSMPRKPKDNEPPGLYWNEPRDHVTDFKLFMDYCKRDVETEEAAERRLVPLSAAEQQVWLLDQKINRRGIRIDLVSASAAIDLAEKAKTTLDREMRDVTGGYVLRCSEPAKLVAWVQSQGVVLSSAAKADLEELLSFDDIPEHVRKAVMIRQEAAKTSVSKISAMMARASKDGRVRGSFLYHGASTGRWSNVGVNFANMPRPRKIFEKAAENGLDRSDVFAAIRTKDPDHLVERFGPELGRPLHLLSDAIRGFIWAAPGHDLVQADYSGIEGAVVAWLAGEKWKLDAMFGIIADPSLPDLYRRAAANIMNTTTDVVTKKHPYRQSVGKVSELALGFGGGVPAFYSMAKVYGVDLDAIYAPVWEAATPERREKAIKRYENSLKRNKDRTDELSREAWLASELIKVGWRADNPAIAKSWADLEGAVRSAVTDPGTVHEAAKCSYRVAHGFLWCLLPSGRCLAYGAPRLRDQVWAKYLLPDGEWSDAEVVDREVAEKMERQGKLKIEGRTASSITALGVNSTTKKWERFNLYGGLICENVTQATARDLLVNGMWKAEQAGYPIIATVYDEIIAEVPRGFGSVEDFERVICEMPAWAAGLPLTASGWRGKRYRKD